MIIIHLDVQVCSPELATVVWFQRICVLVDFGFKTEQVKFRQSDQRSSYNVQKDGSFPRGGGWPGRLNLPSGQAEPVWWPQLLGLPHQQSALSTKPGTDVMNPVMMDSSAGLGLNS